MLTATTVMTPTLSHSPTLKKQRRSCAMFQSQDSCGYASTVSVSHHVCGLRAARTNIITRFFLFFCCCCKSCFPFPVLRTPSDKEGAFEKQLSALEAIPEILQSN